MRITRIPVLTWVKRSAIAAVLVAIVGVLVWSMWPKPIPIETLVVRRGPLAVTVDEDGRARVRDRFVVAAPLAGTLARIDLRPGDSVSTGAVIARIAPLPPPLHDLHARKEIDGRLAIARARQKQAAAAVARVEASERYARQELTRIEQLVARDAVPRVELDRQTLAAHDAARELESARFGAAIAADELATARVLAARMDEGTRVGDEEELVVRAPVDGSVLRVLTTDESAVAPGTPLVELGDASRLEIAVDVLTADAADIHPGAPVELMAWGGPSVPGRVRLVEPSARTRVSALGVEEQRVAVIVDLAAPREVWRALGDGWRVEARITTWSSDDVLQVPLGALVRDGERWAVYVVAGGRAHLRHVEVGHRGAGDAEIVKGLAAGEQVIYHPGDRITDGARVTAR